MCFKVSSLMLEAFKLFEETGICRFSLSFASQGYTEGKERTLRWVPTQTADCSLCGTNSLPLSCCFPVVRIKDLTVLLRVQSSLAGLLCRRCLRGLLAESLPGRGTLQVSITVWLSLGNTTTWSWFGLKQTLSQRWPRARAFCLEGKLPPVCPPFSLHFVQLQTKWATRYRYVKTHQISVNCL